MINMNIGPKDLFLFLILIIAFYSLLNMPVTRPRLMLAAIMAEDPQKTNSLKHHQLDAVRIIKIFYHFNPEFNAKISE